MEHKVNYEWIAAYSLNFLDNDFDNYDLVVPKAQKSKGGTVLNDVWIGAESMILPGIQIAGGAVIGTRGLITKNVGAYEIWGRNPARLIKKQFTQSEMIYKNF